MRADEYEALIKASLERRMEMSRRKRADYAGEDVLANFKRLGEAARVLRINKLWDTQPALAYALFMEVMKVDRLVNLSLKSTAPQNETMEDSWDDMKNYGDLAEAIYLEERDRAIIIHAHPALSGALNTYKGQTRKKKL